MRDCWRILAPTRDHHPSRQPSTYGEDRMTGEHSFALRALIGSLCGAASIATWTLAPKTLAPPLAPSVTATVAPNPSLDPAQRFTLSPQRFSQLFLAAFALSRLVLYTIALLLLRIPPHGDVTLYMAEAAHAPGHLVYRDFLTNHAPLSPYLLNALLHLHHSPLTLILCAILFDIAAMFVWMKAAPHFLDPLTLRRAALLVLCNPSSLVTEAIDGQMNSLVALLLALAVYFLVTRRDTLSGISVALAAATVRFTTLIYAPGFLFASRRKLPALLGFLSVLLLIYGGFALAGADITTPLRLEGPHKTASNLIFLTEFATGHDLNLRLPILLLALSWLAVVTLVFFCMKSASASQQTDLHAMQQRVHQAGPETNRRLLHILTLSLIAELLCIQIFSKNAWDRYLVMTMFPLCTLAAELTFTWTCAFALWTIAAVTEPSLWATLAHSLPAVTLHPLLLAGDPISCALLLVETLYVTGSILLLFACIRRMLQLRFPTS